MSRVLIVSATTGYQTRAFEDAALSMRVELVYATDRCLSLENLRRDAAITVRFDDAERSAEHVVQALANRPVDGVIGLGDRPSLVAAHVAAVCGLPFHRPDGVRAAINKVLTRGRLLAAGLPVPWFISAPVDAPLDVFASRARFPCVIKPIDLSASRGVIRANTVDEFEAARVRLRAMLGRERETHPDVLVEGFVPGLEYALEGTLDRGSLHVFAVFAKPNPLDGPFFEETIYVTPPAMPEAAERAIAEAVTRAAIAIGLGQGPVHAECRVNATGVYVHEVAPRPIGGLCGRALRFRTRERGEIPFEEVLLRSALGRGLDGVGREAAASGVMMMPVPGRGRLRRVDGIDVARQVDGVREVVVTAVPGQLLEPLPEGHSYPGFIFATGTTPEQVVARLRESHRAIEFQLDRDLLR